jgi:hypothetical protein
MRGKFFDAFEDGSKDSEYRPFGPRWNVRTCAPGRRVVISRGYGKHRRRTGVIVGFHICHRPARVLLGWSEVYGFAANVAIVIKIKLDPIPAK